VADERLREHLANERTHLAYVRTAIALLGFGLSINRFALFLVESQTPPREPRWALVNVRHLGAAMVVAGLVLIVFAMLRYRQVARAIERGDFRPSQAGVWVLSTAILLIAGASLWWLFAR
jgi:putative membrane protein